jgi:hypothetical protein
VLEEVRPDDLERLAHHYRGAATEADPDRAVDVLLAAAERADRVHAAEEAAGYLTAALDLARAHRPALVGTLLERAGEAWRRGGRITAAVAAWREAVEMRVLEGDVRAAARLHSRLALAEWDRAPSAQPSGNWRRGCGSWPAWTRSPNSPTCTTPACSC